MPGWDAWQPPAERAGHKREEETPAVKKTLVEELMTIPVVTATKAIPFRDLAALLYARDIGAVPVVTAAGQVLGIVSNRDLIEKAAGPPAAAGPRQHGSRRRDRRSLGRTAGDLMTAPAVTIPPHATIGQAAGSCTATGLGGCRSRPVHRPPGRHREPLRPAARLPAPR